MKKIFRIFLIVLTVLTLFSVVTVSAESNDDMVEFKCPVHGSHMVSKGIDYRMYKMADTVYHNLIFDNEGLNDNTSVESALKFDINGPFKNIWNTVKAIYDNIAIIGIVLALIVISIDMMDRMTSNQLNPEILFLMLIKFGAVCLIILNGTQILEWILRMNSFIFDKISIHFNDFLETSDICVYEKVIENSDIFVMIGKWIYLILPYLVIYLCQIIVKVVAWSRIISIVVYTIFTPIGIADLSGGTTSSGIRYLRTVAGKLLQGPLIAGLFTIYKMIVSTVQNSSGLQGFWVNIVLTLVFVTLTVTSDQIAKEITG